MSESLTVSEAVEAVVMMTKVEAEECLFAIKWHLDQTEQHASGARKQAFDLHQREGWRSLGYSSWRDCVTQEFGLAKSQLYRELAAALIEERIDSPMGEIPERQLRPLSQLPAAEQADAWRESVETAPEGRVTGKHVQDVVNRRRSEADADHAAEVAAARDQYVASAGEADAAWDSFDDEPAPASAASPSAEGPVNPPTQEGTSGGGVSPISPSPDPSAQALSKRWQGTVDAGGDKPDTDFDTDAWETPDECLGLVRAVLGWIDLDPASNDQAQQRVCADKHLTEADDGLSRDWHGRVFLNPPYSYPKVRQFTEKLVAEFDSGRVTAAVLLVNDCTDVDWWHALARRFPVCFTDGRVSFVHPQTGQKYQNRRGQSWFYLGPDVERFAEVFSSVGLVMRAVQSEGDADA